MSINELRFTKDWTNPVDFPTYEDNETQVRADMQCLYDEIKAYLNNILLPGLTTNGAENTLLSSGQSVEAAINDRYTKLEADARTATETNDLVKDWTVDVNTGVMTVTKKDGTTESYDTVLEKVPATFELVTEGSSVYLKITNVDGSSTKTDVTSLLNIYNFSATNTIAFNVTGTGNTKAVTANVRDNSITLDMLALDALTQLQQWATQTAANAEAAASSETNAKTSANNAKTSETNASAYADSAQTYAESAKASDTAASTKVSQASASATEAQSWAVGGTGTRSGEDTNNAKYWSEQAQAVAGGDFATRAEAQGYANTAETNAKAYTDEAVSSNVGAYIVTFNNETSTFDKTYDEVSTAVSSGKQVLLNYNGQLYPCAGLGSINGSTAIAFGLLTPISNGLINQSFIGMKADGTKISDNIYIAKAGSITNNRAAYIDSVGSVASSAVTNIELGYLSGAKSNIQNQIDSKANSSSLPFVIKVALDGTSDKTFDEITSAVNAGKQVILQSESLSDVSSAVVYNYYRTRTLANGNSVHYFIYIDQDYDDSSSEFKLRMAYMSSSSTTFIFAYSRLPVFDDASLTDKAVYQSAGGRLTASETTATELGYLSGVTSNVQTQLNSKAPSYTYGTTDLTAGTSTLETGKLYFVYEE